MINKGITQQQIIYLLHFSCLLLGWSDNAPSGVIFSIIQQMFYGRKPCDIEFRRHQYQNHIRKLQAVKSGRSDLQRSLQRNRRDIEGLLKTSHQMHHTSLREEFKRRELTELESQRRSYNNVRSIVKSELNRKMLTVPPKHRPNTYFLDRQNLKLIDKIVNAKSQFDFKKQTLQKLATARVRSEMLEDYSNIYHHSALNQRKNLQIHLKLGKERLNTKVLFRFMGSDQLESFKRDALFAIELEGGGKSKQSKLYPLQELLKAQFHIAFSTAGITLHFMERVGERMVKKFRLAFSEQQLGEERVWTSKVIEDGRNRVIGLVELQLRRKREEGKRKEQGQVLKQQQENADPMLIAQ